MEAEKSIKEQIEIKEAEFNALFKKRTESKYEFEIGSTENLKLLQKYLKEKNIDWNGLESIGYTNAVNKIDEVLGSEDRQVDEKGIILLEAYLMEAISYFLGKFKGYGYFEAKKFATVAYPVQKTVLQIRKEDEELKQLREEIGQLHILGGPSEEDPNASMETFDEVANENVPVGTDVSSDEITN